MSWASAKAQITSSRLEFKGSSFVAAFHGQVLSCFYTVVTV